MNHHGKCGLARWNSRWRASVQLWDSAIFGDFHTCASAVGEVRICAFVNLIGFTHLINISVFKIIMDFFSLSTFKLTWSDCILQEIEHTNVHNNPYT